MNRLRQTVEKANGHISTLTSGYSSAAFDKWSAAVREGKTKPTTTTQRNPKAFNNRKWYHSPSFSHHEPQLPSKHRTQAEIVSISTHKLWWRPALIAMPLIIIPDLANNTAWLAAVHGSDCSRAAIRRSGYGKSDVSSEKYKRRQSPRTCDLLLRSAKSGLCGRCAFMGRDFVVEFRGHPGDVIGMVFIEANQERTLEVWIGGNWLSRVY